MPPTCNVLSNTGSTLPSASTTTRMSGHEPTVNLMRRLSPGRTVAIGRVGDAQPPSSVIKPTIEISERIVLPNAKVSDGSQPPLTFESSLSETAGSRSLHRLVRCGPDH